MQSNHFDRVDSEAEIHARITAVIEVAIWAGHQVEVPVDEWTVLGELALLRAKGSFGSNLTLELELSYDLAGDEGSQCKHTKPAHR
jgi:hypothetical protein